MASNPAVRCSIIVPLYDEQDNVEPLYARIIEAMPADISFELVLVDDGSRDRTFELAKEIALNDSRIRVVRFRRNFGQTPAMAAGMQAARGSVLVTIDGDLQNDPSDIPMLLEHIEEGFDIVVGWRYQRKDQLLSRKIPSVLANWLIGKVTGVPIRDNGCSLKAYRAELIKSIPLYSEMHRFIPALTSLAGVRLKEVKVKHHARQFGVSKYGLSRTFKVLSDLIVVKAILSFSGKPLHWFTVLAAPLLLLGVALVVIGSGSVLGFDFGSLIVFNGIGLLLVACGLFLVLCGAIGELIYRTADSRVEDLAALTVDIEHAAGETG